MGSNDSGLTEDGRRSGLAKATPITGHSSGVREVNVHSPVVRGAGRGVPLLGVPEVF
jgi:hypothetical protein